MDNCKHVSKLRLSYKHSLMNPQKWHCHTCGTTESVWACLKCSNVACGRFNGEHALKHFQEKKHPLAFEVNEKYIYCYECDDYVLNDNAAGDVKVLRSALSAITTQRFADVEQRGRRLLRSYTHTGIISSTKANVDEDKLITAKCHRRQVLLGKVFTAWRTFVKQKKKNFQEASGWTSLKKRTLISGVTGLRNLGNTCYMNSILQTLSHLERFRNFFLSMQFSTVLNSQEKSVIIPATPVVQSAASSGQTLTRQTTVECFQHLMFPKKKSRARGGLNGGASHQRALQHQISSMTQNIESKITEKQHVSLSRELHGLFRVLWSGKWAVVSPHALLQAVWSDIPVFRGHSQHDAQEFLCELLDKVQAEQQTLGSTARLRGKDIVSDTFQGELVSEVTCLSCGQMFQTFEQFMDLSLEFPDRYQITDPNGKVANDICLITEMLSKFTAPEYLEGEVYACGGCNSKRQHPSSVILTKIKKQFLLNKLPHILRLHLKRFRWSGRYHREKISTHVAFNEELDLLPFCTPLIKNKNHLYQLSAVTMHHGRGFGCGHYTAYCRNREMGSWMHCNDTRMQACSLDQVYKAQAYILVYSLQPSLRRQTVYNTRSTKPVFSPTHAVATKRQNQTRTPDQLKIKRHRTHP